jgi:hypothetical protein
MPSLDGKEPVKAVPFDAHEQVVRQPHTHSLEEGYKPLEGEPEHQEYPKAVDHVAHPSGVGQEAVVVADAQAEEEYEDNKANEEN